MSIYKPFDTLDIVSSSQTVVTTGLWSEDAGELTTVYLSTDQIGKSGEYYLDVYDKNPDVDETAEVQFSVAYGHVSGGGAPSIDENNLAKLPTEVIYSQYRNLLLGQNETKFSFEGATSDHIYVINFQRSRLRERLDPGNWELPLSGTNGLLTFIDDSNDTLEAFSQTTAAGRVYKVVQGTINTPTGSRIDSASFNGQGFGLVYPDLGIIVLNPNAIGPAVGFYTSGSDTQTAVGITTGSAYAGAVPLYTSTNVDDLDTISNPLPFAPVTGSVTSWSNQLSSFNHAALYVSIRNAVDGVGEFRARSAENISSTHYFVRLRSAEFNYSNNPTFKDEDNRIIIPTFKSDPRVYVTTVGLYNDNNELLAVAKLSKPVRKSFTEEILLRVRLDY
jgi:hypothetical protein